MILYDSMILYVSGKDSTTAMEANSNTQWKAFPVMQCKLRGGTVGIARLRLARLARLTSLLRAFPEAMMLLKGRATCAACKIIGQHKTSAGQLAAPITFLKSVFNCLRQARRP